MESAGGDSALEKEIIGHISFEISHLSFRKAGRRFSQIKADQNDGLTEIVPFWFFSLICVYLRKSAAGFPK